MPIISAKEPKNAWHGPAYDDIILDGSLCEKVYKAIEAGMRLRQRGRHTVMLDPTKKGVGVEAYITQEEFDSF